MTKASIGAPQGGPFGHGEDRAVESAEPQPESGDAEFWYRRSVAEVLERLDVDRKRGLTGGEASRRLEVHGSNELIGGDARSPWAILVDQLTSTMVVILIVAAVVSAALGDLTDAIAILAIVILNALLGFSQENRAEKAMAALKKMARPSVRVRRDGRIGEVPSSQVVPGDIVMLATGDQVPADCRLVECAALRGQEAPLTGESAPVDKHARPIDGEVALADRENMVFSGTTIVRGHGVGVVTATGMRTELGGIARMIQSVRRDQTPLQKRLDRLGRNLAVAALAIVAIVFSLGLMRGEGFTLMFLTAVSMAVAAVPEGLPAVVTIALALGARRMLDRNALIRKLPAVETLGSVTVICSDKTGTLTENRMAVTRLDLAGEVIDMNQTGDAVTAEGVRGLPGLDAFEGRDALGLLLAGIALCNDAVLDEDDGEGARQLIGDPTEVALVEASLRAGIRKPELDLLFPRVFEVPFDSDAKLMTTVHEVPRSRDALPQELEWMWGALTRLGSPRLLAVTKGAPEAVLALLSSVLTSEEADSAAEGSERRAHIREANDRLAGNGLRVLGVAVRGLDALPDGEDGDEILREMVFAGLVGMVDPPRAEAHEAVGRCRTAGIRPVMITGDHPLTAAYIARELEFPMGDKVVPGSDLDGISDEDLEGLVCETGVYARVTPEHKLRIIEALRRNGQVVAMTGDGVNDAPALKRADIGVAMGITGTDVSKEAADMVLLDDNFATIVAAVEVGRVIFDNVRKFVKYTLTSNSGEIWVMLIAPFVGMPLPLLPIQILWINLATDGLPGLALAVEPAERNTMERKPYHPNESIFARGLGRHVVWVGILMGFVSLACGYWYYAKGDPAWQTVVFTTLTLLQMGHALAIRSERDSLFRIGIGSNLAMLGAVSLTLLAQIAIVYVPFLQQVFSTQALGLEHLLVVGILSTVVFWAVEIEKWIVRRR